MRPIVACAALLSATLLLTACGGPVRFEDPNGAIEVQAGESFELALEANPSTGYEWRLAEPLDEAVVMYRGSEYEPEPGSDNAPGSGGTRVLTFEAAGEGRATISLEYSSGGDEGQGDRADVREIEVTSRR